MIKMSMIIVFCLFAQFSLAETTPDLKKANPFGVIPMNSCGTGHCMDTQAQMPLKKKTRRHKHKKPQTRPPQKSDSGRDK